MYGEIRAVSVTGAAKKGAAVREFSTIAHSTTPLSPESAWSRRLEKKLAAKA